VKRTDRLATAANGALQSPYEMPSPGARLDFQETIPVSRVIGEGNSRVRFARPRFSIRHLMILVAIVGLATWLIVTAVRVSRDTSGQFLYHIHRFTVSGHLSGHTHRRDDTFWPRYRRALLGQPWPGNYRCSCEEELRRKIRAHFEVIFSTTDAKEFFDRMERLSREQSRPSP
jgi:hypothetical protein